MSQFDLIECVAGALRDIPAATFGRQITVALGPEFLARWSDPPRVVFVPAPDRTSPPQYTRPSNGAGNWTQKPYKLLTEACDVWCWGEYVGTRDASPLQDYRATENLQMIVRRLLYQYAAGAVDYQSGSWVQASNVVKRGRCYRFRFTTQVPLIETHLPTEAVPQPTPQEGAYPEIPSGTVFDTTVQIDESGTPETAWQGDITPEGE